VEAEVYRGLDLDLERALRANEIEVHYQPQIDVSSGRAVGCEALVRWSHPVAGEVKAATIVGIAERTGLIGMLTHAVLNAALRQAAEWRGTGIAPRIAVNLSVSMLIDRELPTVIDQGVKMWSVAPAALTLEIAESALIADAERSAAVLTRLKAIGVQLALDDFGSGFTSLAQLKRLPFDELKIDRPFIAGLVGDAGDAAVVRSAIDIGHHFGMRVVAEGVEDAATYEALKSLGCDVAQGHIASPALAPAALLEWWSLNAGA
jgi:EAL domain-containing protein (putative c-di-GMP-specific phosphodiesterase class I)